MASLAKFFKKAAPLADDIAGAIVNYGDDAARLAANYGDDALAIADKVDNFLPPASVADLSAQATLKERLIDKRLPYDHYEYIPAPASTSEEISDFIQRYSEVPMWGRFPRSTKTLGNATTDLFSMDSIVPVGSDNMRLRRAMDTSDLVVDDLKPLGRHDKQFTLRPHKNTALGRWYDETLRNNMIKDSFLYNDPDSPLFDLDEYYKGIKLGDGELPF